MRSIAALALAAALVAPVAGCGKAHVSKPVTPPIVQPPTPDSPANALRLVQWSWDHRDSSALASALTDDFEFFYLVPVPDSLGGGTQPATPMTRDEMLCTSGGLFVGGGRYPRATSITLAFDSTLQVTPDPRPGMDPRVHKAIVTTTDVSIALAGGGSYQIHGGSSFFVVRGDSAAIPFDLQARGIRADSTRWFVQVWDDAGSLVGGTSLGDVMDLYRCKAPPGPTRF